MTNISVLLNIRPVFPKLFGLWPPVRVIIMFQTSPLTWFQISKKKKNLQYFTKTKF